VQMPPVDFGVDRNKTVKAVEDLDDTDDDEVYFPKNYTSYKYTFNEGPIGVFLVHRKRSNGTTFMVVDRFRRDEADGSMLAAEQVSICYQLNISR
jgi:hypothetical protein